ncbi:hypothetical protein H0H92_010916 [Tricholoma furcatifolium]|nr:hypothetical protein H0H92_010916 [Tricholoma furcatifolium]
MQLPLLLPKPQLSTSLFLTKQTGEDEAFQRLWRSYLDISNNAVDPLQLWIVQLVVIVGTATLLSRFLREIRQPKVIAEFLGGIILGPTVCGRIPGFTNTVFPPESLPYIKLTADIGLCLFLFLVGLEIDTSVLKKNLRVSTSIAFAGMVFPFIVGAGVSVPLYHQFMDMPMDDTTGQVQVHFTHFVFFAGVAFSVTAFPVLCRILVDAKLLDTTVGVAVLSAGVGNDNDLPSSRLDPISAQRRVSQSRLGRGCDLHAPRMRHLDPLALLPNQALSRATGEDDWIE